MDWKHPYYLRGDVMGHGLSLILCTTSVMVSTGGTFLSCYILQMITCCLQLCYLPPTLIVGWTGQRHWGIPNSSIMELSLKHYGVTKQLCNFLKERKVLSCFFVVTYIASSQQSAIGWLLLHYFTVYFDCFEKSTKKKQTLLCAILAQAVDNFCTKFILLDKTILQLSEMRQREVG